MGIFLQFNDMIPMRKFLWIIVLPFWLQLSYSQDILDELNEITEPSKTITRGTFKSSRIINTHSIETVAKNHLDFRISHRFGRLNTGAYELFGLDQATIRLGFEYGVSDRFMIGLGRSSNQKAYDFFAKYRLLQQSDKTPLSITALLSSDVVTLETSPQLSFSNNQERWAYVLQFLLARKFSDKLSLQLSPTFIHRNKVETETEPNDTYAVSLGGRFKLTKRLSLNAEYVYVLPYFWEPNAEALDLERNPDYHNSLSLGFDIETGGHVFQLHFTNSLGMIERQFVSQTTGQWGEGDIHYGFNISRTFSFDKKSKSEKKKW